MSIEKTDFQIEIIYRLKELRQNHKATQAYVSDILELSSYGLIGNIESPRYKHKYTLKQIDKLCKEFNVSIESIFLNEDELKYEKDEYIRCLINKIIEYGG